MKNTINMHDVDFQSSIDFGFEGPFPTKVYDLDIIEKLSHAFRNQETEEFFRSLVAYEQSLSDRGCRLEFYRTLVKWLFDEKRLGKEDWISYEDTLDDDDFMFDYNGFVDNDFYDDGGYESEDEFYERCNACKHIEW